MNKCSPVEMRKNLEIVDLYKKLGIDFVAVPVMNENQKNAMIAQADLLLKQMIIEIESEEGTN